MYDMPLCKCLDCGEVLDAATETGGGTKPKSGDATVCMYCGHIMVFAHNLVLRAPTGAEMYELAGHPQLLRIQRALAAMKAEGKS